MILLAKELVRYNQPGLRVMDITVERNAYGRQIESFEDEILIPTIGKDPIRAVFIRAPRIAHIRSTVDILARYEGYPVLVRQKNMLAGSFHPELVRETRLHQFFFSLVNQAKKKIEHSPAR
jgi:5'-phosphate synthase pdxT subunit